MPAYGPEYKVYKPQGNARQIFSERADEVVVDGPAGTGKSRAVLEKINLAALKYAGMRALMVRKTRASLTQSAMVTFEQNVIVPNGEVSVYYHGGDQEYRYSNGSTIVTGGLDKSSKIMSTEYDLIYAQEGTELTEPEWEDLTTRARNGVMPYNQVLMDCNPGPARHWVKQRWETGKAARVKSVHKDNPRLWDESSQAWTPFGETYIRKLQNLSGVRRKRLYEGLWVSSEGMIYEVWDPLLHLVNPFEIPESWRRFLSIDFGFTNPFVCQWWAVDEDERMFCYREIYKTRRTVKEHAAQITELSGNENIEVAVCDWDAEDRATLEENGISTIPAEKAVSVGIEHVQERLKVQGDGRARMYFFRDRVVETDTDLEDNKLPTNTDQEFDGYMWSVSRSTGNKESPVKKDDHGMDCSRYAVMYADQYSATGGIYA
jgi:phage terminase large subunit